MAITSEIVSKWKQNGTSRERCLEIAPSHIVEQVFGPAAVVAEPVGTAVAVAEPEPDEVSDDEIKSRAVVLLEQKFSDDDIKRTLQDEYNGLNDKFLSEVLLHAHEIDAQSVQTAIKLTEADNEEMLEEVPSDIEYSLPKVPKNATPEQKLEVLQEQGERLADILNHPDDYPKKPKFGSGLAVFMPLMSGGVFLDENQVNVDTGKRVELTVEAQQLHQKRLDERRAERALEAVQKLDAPLQPDYAMTEEEIEEERSKEYPVFLLAKQPGPEWNDSILYGPAGQLIVKAAQYNESHPAGMLVDFLVSLGSIIGRGPYFNISATRHYPNEFMARVGDSSKSRKGTGRDVIDQVLKMVDSVWYRDRVESGFGSGEAIVSAIRDESTEMRMTRNGGFEPRRVPGVTDKRLCIREGELASIFVLAGKPESRADIVMRDGWDGKPLRNVVKGKTKDGFSNSAKCEEPHLSISGDTTIHELRMKMPAGADENGFGNRFLYVYVYRVKLCPQGSPDLDWTEEIQKFHKIIEYARSVKHVGMTDSARQWWNDNYHRFEQSGVEGLAGKMLTRAAAHVRRLAMLYALIDMTDTISREHFVAAERLWSYCEESAIFIFGGMTKEQMRILKWIENRGAAATVKQVREELYSRNRKVADIRGDLAHLVKVGRLSLNGERYTVR
jgi:hypothetical protein